uniref:Coiled-coil domain-containing protein 102A n=2 Tax=Lutzomyia longipalpis TaxID=7200 RepID=A0A1B0CCC8_LUTLO
MEAQVPKQENGTLSTEELQRQRELDELRARASQMEKTMKWWSDCTANWREKWSKVRTERNKARDEAKQLRTSLEAAIKESTSYKKEKTELEMQINQLKKEMEKIHMLLMKHAGQFHKSGLETSDEPLDLGNRDNESPDISSDGLKNVNNEDGLVIKSDYTQFRDSDIETCMLQGATSKVLNDQEDNDDQSTEERKLIQQLFKGEEGDDDEYFKDKLSLLNIRLDEAYQTIEREKEEKVEYQKNVEKLANEVRDLKVKCEELRLSKQDAVRELLTLQEQHRAEVRISNNTLQDEVNARESLERRLCEVRMELERMQAENAAEWGKRERLETDKLMLERDNKKLRSELRDFQERVDRRGRSLLPSTFDLELRNLQQELVERNKKLLSESNTELGHAVRRAEQYECEVKRLRARIEELKRELARVEDELDLACNQVRKLQRTNEELNGGENLQVNRSSTSPKTQSFSYKPNINDLRQLFDDSKRGGIDYRGGFPPTKGQVVDSKGQQIPQSMFDAKGSFLDSENSLDGRHNKNNMFDFERAKQKFDKSGKLSSKNSSCGSRNASSSGRKFTESLSTDLGISKHNFNETVQFFDENLRKKDGSYMKTSLNLDDLKISDDEVV